MIRNRATCQDYIRAELELYRQIGYHGAFHAMLTQCEIGLIVRFQKALRLDEFYSNTCQRAPLRKLLALHYRRKHNRLGTKLGLRIPINVFGKGLLIYHPQGIVVHADARCGQYCKLHGRNCIGNNGSETGQRNTPILGDRVDLGTGATVIGGITLADDVTVAAGAVVCKDCTRPGSTLAGVPARSIK